MLLLASIFASAWIWAIDALDVPPRSLARYIERRAAGHNAWITGLAGSTARGLMRLDRGNPIQPLPASLPMPASESSAAARTGDRIIDVGTAEQARSAIEQARAGDVIQFAPGRYYFFGPALAARAAGSAQAPIVVRAAAPGTVELGFDLVEGFLVSGPHWMFENLTIRGLCKRHADCEHAFHVVGRARHFVARGNTLLDFNAHFKINAYEGAFPDEGLIEGNVLGNLSVRDTDNPVTPIDAVAASGWLVRANRISDFVKAQGDRTSYGAFFKGAGAGNRFERNVVICEHRLHGLTGQRVGLSFGGGGSQPQACRDKQCITEHEDGTIEANLIAACSDDGIYLNRAARSRVRHNTLLDTGGIVARFAETGAEVEANLVDGAVRARDGARLYAQDNLATPMWRLYLGRHPVRDLFTDTAALDLRWRAAAPRRSAAASSPDLCVPPRQGRAAYGATEDYVACLAAPPKARAASPG